MSGLAIWPGLAGFKHHISGGSISSLTCTPAPAAKKKEAEEKKEKKEYRREMTRRPMASSSSGRATA